MNLNFSFFLTLITIALFTSCKRYPEDHFINLKKPEKRLKNTTWTIESFLVNGQDSSSQNYHSSIIINGNNGVSYNFKNLVFNIKIWKDKGYNDKPIIIHSFELSQDGGIVGGGSWSLTDNDANIKLDGGYDMYLFDHYPNPQPLWKILKLDHKDFHIQAEYNNKTYEIKLKKYRS